MLQSVSQTKRFVERRCMQVTITANVAAALLCRYGYGVGNCLSGSCWSGSSHGSGVMGTGASDFRGPLYLITSPSLHK